MSIGSFLLLASMTVHTVSALAWVGSLLFTALVLSLPVTLVVAACTLPAAAPDASALFGFVYVGACSMFAGFVVWYAGLARGGIARVGQLQLFQPLLTVGWSALVLGETIGWTVVVAGLGVIASVAVTQRSRVRRR